MAEEDSIVVVFLQEFVGKFQDWGSLVQISVDKIHVY